MLRTAQIRPPLRLISVVLIGGLFVVALVRLWVHHSETYLDFAQGPGPHASQITEFGQFAFLRRVQVFYGANSPHGVEKHTTLLPVGIGESALATVVVAGLVLALIAPGMFSRIVRSRPFGSNNRGQTGIDPNGTYTVAGEWKRLAILGLLAVLAGTVTCLICGFFYLGLSLTPLYLAGVAFRIFFADLVPTLLIIVLVHLSIRKLQIPRSALLVIFLVVGLLVCKLTNTQWWSIAIAVTISAAAWLLYVVGPLRIWRVSAE
jgi:hypothetical protein